MATVLQEVLKTHALEINQGVLSRLTTKQLTTFCGLLGIPTSGSRAKKIERILIALPIRFWLKEYMLDWNQKDHADAHRVAGIIARSFSGKQLDLWCRQTKLYLSPSKGGKALGLMQWVRDCRMKGNEYHKRHVSERYIEERLGQPSLWHQP